MFAPEGKAEERSDSETSRSTVDHVAPAGRPGYSSDFYAAFQPQTALDMIARTPGFVLDGGQDDVMLRGFGANSANVLINGQRPTVKAGGITAVLGRLSASRVERIELIRGGLNAEAQGQALVANIVLKADAGSSGTAQFEMRRAPGDDRITPRVELSYARPLGSWELSGGLVAFDERNPISGRYLLTDENGVPIERSDERFDEDYRGVTVTGAASRPWAGGTLSLNGRLNHERVRYDQRITPVAGAAIASLVEGFDAKWDGELAGDWTGGIGRDWGMKLVGLARAERSKFSEALESANAADEFRQRSNTRELVGRATVSRQGTHKLRPEIGAEIAWNRLSARLAFNEAGVPVTLPGSNTQLEELRGELFANLNAQIRPTLRLEMGIAHERSRITVQGGTAAARSLNFWKPSGAVVWDMTSATQLRLGWQRTVGQLDFENFAAAGNLIDDRPIAGNAELRPEVTESLSLRLDHRFGQGGAVSLTGSRETVDDALSYVPLEGGGEALLNFGRVDLWKIKGEATLPLNRLMTGAQLTANGSIARARRRDAVTGQKRDDDRDFSEIEIAFRHDIAEWRSAYGFSVEMSTAERFWYIAEIERTRFRPYVTGYIETTVIPGLKTTLTVSGITGDQQRRLRTFSSPDRAGPLSGFEHRDRQRGAYVNLLLVRQF